MKKRTQVMALVLCLILSAFAFASCGKEKKPATTTASGACVHEWGDYVEEVAATCSSVGMKVRYCKICKAPDPETVEIPKLAHTESEDFKTLSDPTCSAAGYKTKFCTVCGANLDGTGEDIPADSTKHNVESWTVTSPVSLFNQTGGKREGICTLCKQTVKEDLTFEMTVLEINSTTKDNYVVKSSYEEEILGADKHFYPTSDNAAGDDLFIEFSILWNHTLPDNCTGVMKTGNCGSSFKDNNVTTSWMAICNNDPDSWCPYAGGFEGCDLGDVESGPATMITKNAPYSGYPNITGAVEGSPEWGWHRMTVRFHQEVTNADALKADTSAGATQALYKLTATYYIDGVEVAQLSYSGDGKSNGGYWQSGSGKKMEKGLFTAESDGEGGIIYRDCYENNAPYAYIAVVGKATAAENPGYVVLCDVSFTCGKAPVQDVRRVDAPVGDQTYTITEGVVVPANAYYKLAD